MNTAMIYFPEINKYPHMYMNHSRKKKRGRDVSIQWFFFMQREHCWLPEPAAARPECGEATLSQVASMPSKSLLTLDRNQWAWTRVDPKWCFQFFAQYDYRSLLHVIIAIIATFFLLKRQLLFAIITQYFAWVMIDIIAITAIISYTK